MADVSNISSIEMNDETLLWGGEPSDLPYFTPPRIQRKKMTLLDPLDIYELDKYLVAWSDREYHNKVTVLNAEIGNLLYDILDDGRKEAVLNSLIDKIATSKNVSELSVPLWSYNTVEYDNDQEGTSWADKPYQGFDTMREWARDAGYETYISASNVTVHEVIIGTAALHRLKRAFNDEHFIVETVKTLQGTINNAKVYTVNLVLEFWPGGVPLWRKYSFDR